METGLIALFDWFVLSRQHFSGNTDCLSPLSNLTTLDLSTCDLSHVHLTPGCVSQLHQLSLGYTHV